MPITCEKGHLSKTPRYRAPRRKKRRGAKNVKREKAGEKKFSENPLKKLTNIIYDDIMNAHWDSGYCRKIFARCVIVV